MELLYFGILAGLLQALGYVLYDWLAVRGKSVPNPLSWLMFAYGTALLLFLEYDGSRHVDGSVDWQILILPAVCFIGSCVVVYRCYRRGGFKKGIDLRDKISFGLDLFLTACYVAAWALLKWGAITEGQRELVNFCVLIAWNVGIFTAFWPMLRDVNAHPDHEHPLPWIVWACAYLTLFVTTFADGGRAHPELLLYPLINFAVHGRLAWQSRHKLRAS